LNISLKLLLGFGLVCVGCSRRSGAIRRPVITQGLRACHQHTVASGGGLCESLRVVSGRSGVAYDVCSRITRRGWIPPPTSPEGICRPVLIIIIIITIIIIIILLL
jgi:hypothetical protein